MGISIRDERGQAVLEYILVLVVAIAIIFGGLYQLNSAFKSWAMNYFGDYLACLLETGELPSIGGTGGDPGVCNQLFKPFSIAEGRRLAGVQASKDDGAQAGNPNGASERDGANRTPYGGGRGYGGTPFTAGKNFGKNQPNAGPGARKLETPPNGAAGSQVNNYGNAFSGYNSRQPPSRIKLDQRFLLNDQREAVQSKPTPIPRTPAEAGTQQGSKKVTYSNKRDANVAAANTGLTIADFLRYLIIAGILIALLLFLGGQALQIGKSMD